jgi:CheY-like chemotaxis protein
MIKLSSVLLVDDDPLTNDLNERLLKQLHVADRYLAVNDGAQALTALENLAAEAQTTSPVLVLLDVKMPGMDGMAFVEAYQKLPADRQEAVVIVMHTASMSSVDLGRIESRPGQQAPHQGQARHHPAAAFPAPVSDRVRVSLSARQRAQPARTIGPLVLPFPTTVPLG